MTYDECKKYYESHTEVWGLEKTKNLLVHGFISKFSGLSITIDTASKKYKATLAENVFLTKEETLSKKSHIKNLKSVKKNTKVIKSIPTSLSEEYTSI